jgi:hypothetical protein
MSSRPLLSSGFQRCTSPSSGFPNCHRPQLLGSHGSSSQRLNRTRPLTHSFTHQPTHCNIERVTSVRLGAEPLETHGQNLFFLLNTCCHSPYITSSLTRGWVCHLQLLLALASSFILGSKSRGTRDHILLSQIRDFPFCRLLRLAGLRWRYSTPPPHGQVKSQSYVTTDGLVRQSLLE